MKEYVEVILGADRCHKVLLLRVTGGQACKKKHKIMLRRVVNAKGLLQTFTSLGVY